MKLINLDTKFATLIVYKIFQKFNFFKFFHDLCLALNIEKYLHEGKINLWNMNPDQIQDQMEPFRGHAYSTW